MFFLLEGVLVGGQIWFDLIPLGEFCSEGKKSQKDNRAIRRLSFGTN